VDTLLDHGQQKAISVSEAPNPEDYSPPDYSTLPDLTATLISVLPANPTFFQQGDFRAIYEKVLKRVIKQARRALKTTAITSDALPSAVTAADKPHVVLDHAYQPTLAGLTELASWSDWVSRLQQLAEGDLPDLQLEVAAMYHARMTSLYLLAQGAQSCHKSSK
jgi:hypothetical protein